jgi:hypothetical protein
MGYENIDRKWKMPFGKVGNERVGIVILIENKWENLRLPCQCAIHCIDNAGHASFIDLAGYRLIIVTKIIITQAIMFRLLVMTITGPAQAELEYHLVVMMACLGLQVCRKKKGYTVQITNCHSSTGGLHDKC